VSFTFADLAFLAPKASGGFSPADLSDLRVWYEADSLGLADAAEVATWTDLSGNGSDVVQATSANRPLYRTNTVNGHAAVEFDGTNDRLRNATAAVYTNTTDRTYTAFAVALTDSVSGVRFILNNQGGSGSLKGPVFLRTDNANLRTTANQNGTAATDLAGATLTTGTWFIAESLLTTTTLEAFVNGTGNGSTAATTNANYSDTLDVGAYTDGTLRWDGKIAEIIVYARALDSTDRTTVRTYLADKYGITI
jgi:hypothetical protein